MSAAGLAFVEAYNRYHTLWAYKRLQGWDGINPEAVPEVVAAELAMRRAFEVLHIAEAGEPRPDYVERARKMINNERQP